MGNCKCPSARWIEIRSGSSEGSGDLWHKLSRAEEQGKRLYIGAGGARTQVRRKRSATMQGPRREASSSAPLPSSSSSSSKKEDKSALGTAVPSLLSGDVSSKELHLGPVHCDVESVAQREEFLQHRGRGRERQEQKARRTVSKLKGM